MGNKNKNIIRTIIAILILALVAFVTSKTLFSNGDRTIQSKSASNGITQSNFDNISSDFEEVYSDEIPLVNNGLDNHNQTESQDETDAKEPQPTNVNEENTVTHKKFHQVTVKK